MFSRQSYCLRMTWHPRQLAQQTGRTFVVTGANSGIGLVTARELARAGAAVILGCRDPERGERALGEVRAAASGADVELGRLDLADLASVRDFASVVSERVSSLDGLVNNAGVMAPPRERDRRRLRVAARHEPPGPLRADWTAARHTPGRQERPCHDRLLDGSQDRLDRFRRSPGRAELQPLATLRPVEARRV